MCLIIVITVYNLLALVEMAWFRRCHEKGRVVYPWIFPVAFLIYALMHISSAVEYTMSQPVTNFLVLTAGIMLAGVRFWMKFHAAALLHGYWSMHIELRHKQALVESGLFSTIRHPGYLSTFFEMTILPLLLQAWITLVWISVVYGAFVVIRCALEEKALLRHLGKAYRDYCSRTWQLIPYVY